MTSINKRKRREQVIAHTLTIIEELKTSCEKIEANPSTISSEVSLQLS